MRKSLKTNWNTYISDVRASGYLKTIEILRENNDSRRAVVHAMRKALKTNWKTNISDVRTSGSL